MGILDRLQVIVLFLVKPRGGLYLGEQKNTTAGRRGRSSNWTLPHPDLPPQPVYQAWQEYLVAWVLSLI